MARFRIHLAGAILMCSISIIQAQIPKVYSIENHNESCAPVNLFDISDLTEVRGLPDPFAWSDGSGRSTDFADWSCRRQEILKELQHYELGYKPDRPEEISASYIDSQIIITIMVDDQLMSLRSDISFPDGPGPHPVIIGMKRPTGTLPPELFENVIQVTFEHDQVVTNSTYNPDDPFYRLYPNLRGERTIGQYSAWSWGVSRIIDGLEILAVELQVDMKHISVTGCSYGGKMALFAGAMDERIALTIVQESGGGGINSWRHSYDKVVNRGHEEVERIGNTNYHWFKDDLKTNFDGEKVYLLPYDHHEVMALIAPRALLVLGNPPYVWMNDESGYISCRATEAIYETFGIADRFGYSFRSDHPHCLLPEESYAEVSAFIDRFLFERSEVSTDIRYQDEFDEVDYRSWIDHWADK